MNGELLASETLAGAPSNQFIEKRYPIPAAQIERGANSRLTIRFVAKDASRSAGVYDVRLMKAGVPAEASR